jgi:hypothetical protein
MREQVELLVAVAEIAADAASSEKVLEVIRIGEREAPQDAEVSFDEVEPGGFGRSEDGADAEPTKEGQKAGVVVDVVEVVHDHEESLARVAGPESAERLEQIRQPLLAAEDATEAVGVDVVEAEELLGTLEPAVGGPAPEGLALLGPGQATDRLELEGAPLVETDYRRALRAAFVEGADAFFFRSKSGSWDVFQVRIRWAVSPSRRRSRLTHSSVTGGRSPFERQYSDSFGTDQFEKGNPRSAGLDRATLTSSRSCCDLRIGGRPLGLGTCSKVLKPLLLKRRTQSYGTVKWQPTLSAVSATL